MALLLTPGRWRRQPSGPTVLNRDHPLARGLVFGTVGGAHGNPDLVGGLRSHPLGTSEMKTFANGVGFWSPSTTGNGWWTTYDTAAFRTIGNEFTVACEFVAEGLGDSSRIVSVPRNNSSFNTPPVAFALRRVTTQTTAMLEIGTATGTQEACTFASAVFADTTSAYVATRKGTTSTLRRNNVLLDVVGNSYTASSLVGYGNATSVVYLNRSDTLGGSGTAGGILYCYIWNRALSDAEQRLITDAPYDILQTPISPTYYLPPATVAPFANGTVGITLPAPTVQARSVSVDQAEFGIEFTSEFTEEFTPPPSNTVFEYSYEYSFEFDTVPSGKTVVVNLTLRPRVTVQAVARPVGVIGGIQTTLTRPTVKATVATGSAPQANAVSLSLSRPTVAVAAQTRGPFLGAGVQISLPTVTVAVAATTQPLSASATASIRLPDLIVRAIGLPIDPLNDPALPHILAPSWRTVDFGTGAQTVNWAAPLGPRELKAYTINCDMELTGVGASISSIKLVPSALATLAGVRFYARTNDERNVTVWLYIDPDDQDKSNWNPPGELHTLICTITTNRGQVFERSIGVTVSKLGYPS
jgi:hypothetical protein